jgi:DDE superfamily endonuclease
MEDRRALYEEPDDPKRPRVCCDERPCQWLADSRPQQPVAPGYPARFDYESTRHGICNLFSMVEPFQGWRHLTVPPRRPKREFAHGMADLVDGHFPEAEMSRAGLDNLRTHTPAALYEVFPPAEARRMLRQLELHPPPGHGSWLNTAESELAVLARQGLNRRIAGMAMMSRETAAWEGRRNRRQATIAWRFTAADARIKLKSLYPKEPL